MKLFQFNQSSLLFLFYGSFKVDTLWVHLFYDIITGAVYQ